MNRIHLVSLVAMREFQERAFSLSYILFGLLFPLFAGGSILSLLISRFEERADIPQSSNEFLVTITQFGFFIAITFSSTLIVGGVTEEKFGRIIEVLLVPLRPSQLLAGKVFGLGALSLIPFVLLAVSGTLVLINDHDSLMDGVTVPLLLVLIFRFLSGYLFFAIGFAALGSLVSRPEEVGLCVMPMAALSVGGLVFASFTVQNPQSVVAVLTSYLPPTASFVVPQRALAGAISTWEHLLASLVMIAAIMTMFRVGGKVYSGGVLHFKNRTSIRDAYRSAEFLMVSQWRGSSTVGGRER